MKKRFTLLASLLLVLPGLSCMAAIGDLFTHGGLNYCITADSEVSVMSYVTEPTGHLVIPGTVSDGTKSYTVTQVSYRAFKGCKGITSVTISEGVKEIADYAFFECRGVESVKLPGTLTSIGDHTFYSCYTLTEVDIPSSVNFIGYEAFGNTSLKKVNTNDIEAWCKIDFDRSAFAIGTDLYLNGELLRNLVIPSTITKIKPESFATFENIISVEIPNSVTTIGEYSFRSTGITEIIIPNSVTTIGEGAFYNCLYLADVSIPASVTTIENDAFAQAAMKRVYITDLEAWCKIDFGNGESNRFCVIKDLYLNGEMVKELVIPESITKIKDYAFHGFTRINKVVLPKKLTSIGISAFLVCPLSGPLDIPESVSHIGAQAFNGCQFITSVTIPDAVKYIGERAFLDCRNLTSLTIGRNVEEFGNYVDYKNDIISDQWAGCDNLTDITYMAANPVDGAGNLSNMFDKETYQKATLHYLDTAKDKIDSRSPWNLFANRDGVSGISDVECDTDAIVDVYNINGLKAYHGPESAMELPSGLYIIIKNGVATKHAVIR